VSVLKNGLSYNKKGFKNIMGKKQTFIKIYSIFKHEIHILQDTILFLKRLIIMLYIPVIVKYYTLLLKICVLSLKMYTVYDAGRIHV